MGWSNIKPSPVVAETGLIAVSFATSGRGYM